MRTDIKEYKLIYKSAMSNEKRYRAYQFTSFILPNPSKYIHYLYGEEICPATNKLHYQGCIYFKNAVGLKTAQSRIGVEKCHIEPAIDYPALCKYNSKDGKITTDGEIPQQGKRNDLLAMYEDMKNNMSLIEIRDNYPCQYIRYKNHVKSTYAEMQPIRNWKTIVIVLWGPTNTYKTTIATEMLNCKPVEWVGQRFIQNYNNEPNVVFDDYEGEIPMRTFLKLTDKYEYSIDVKHGSMVWNPKIIVFTSNIDPINWYGDEPPVFRRLTHIIKLG